MTDTNDTEETDKEKEGVREFLKENPDVSRRDVMKVAGAAGVLSGVAGTASADHNPDSCDDDPHGDCKECEDCEDTKKDAVRGSCTEALEDDCQEVGDRINVEEEVHCKCVDASDIPPDATHAVLKAANDCWVCPVVDPDTSQTFCIPGDHAISHIEFADCPQPRVTNLSATRDTLTIDTEDAVGDSITVDFRLQVEDTSGALHDLLDPDPVTVADGDDGTEDGLYNITLSGLTDDSWDHVAVDSVTHDLTGHDMLAEGGLSSPTVLATPELCNPPEGNKLVTNCETIFIETNEAAAGDELDVDFVLDEMDEDGTLVASGVHAESDVGTTVGSDRIATVTISDFTASTDMWNVLEVTSVEHVLTGTQMLDDSVREPVVVNRTL